MTLLINRSGQGRTDLEPGKCDTLEPFQSVHLLRVNINRNLEDENKE